MPAYDIRGRVALVTGAVRGIGLETARLLHDGGARVVLADLDREATERAAADIGSERVIGIGADVRDRDATAAAVETATDRAAGPAPRQTAAWPHRGGRVHLRVPERYRPGALRHE
jgi:NAD(P)-dependent dehydrogenase (short-subunit alcohol dehydrogenase family)